MVTSFEFLFNNFVKLNGTLILISVSFTMNLCAWYIGHWELGNWQKEKE